MLYLVIGDTFSFSQVRSGSNNMAAIKKHTAPINVPVATKNSFLGSPVAGIT